MPDDPVRLETLVPTRAMSLVNPSLVFCGLEFLQVYYELVRRRMDENANKDGRDLLGFRGIRCSSVRAVFAISEVSSIGVSSSLLSGFLGDSMACFCPCDG